MRVGLLDYDRRLIGFMSDGASVNFGPKSGLLTKLKMDDEKMPWLVGIHRLNQRFSNWGPVYSAPTCINNNNYYY